METFRAELSRDGGVFRLPDSTSHPVSIPEHVKDRENFYVNVNVTRLKPGVSLSQLPGRRRRSNRAPRSTATDCDCRSRRRAAWRCGALFDLKG